MKLSQTISFEFSGCDYHPSAPAGGTLEIALARALLKEGGIERPTDYQANMLRDLLLAFGRGLASNFGQLEARVRADVVQRRGHAEWSAEAVAARAAADPTVGSLA